VVRVTRTIDFPSEWATARPIDTQTYGNEDSSVVLFGCLLRDGSNIFVLVYPGGHRFARVAKYTNWALEERLEGDPPAAEHQALVRRLWRIAIDAVIYAGKATRAELAENRDPWLCLTCLDPPKLKLVTAALPGTCVECGAVLTRRPDVP
jgi:hypothetical protein